MLSMNTHKLIASLSAIAALAAIPAAATAAPRATNGTVSTNVRAPAAPTHFQIPKDTGSAGAGGYDDGMCRGLLSDLKTMVKTQNDFTKDGNPQEAAEAGAAATSLYTHLTNVCMVIY